MSALGLRAATLVAVATLAAPAAAHVDVLPQRAADGQAQEFEIRVPAEGDVATTGVRADFPAEVAAFSLREPPPGWRAQPRLGTDGRLVGATWSGGRIEPGRHQSFGVMATPLRTGTAVWPVVQTLADGAAVRWTGTPAEPGAAVPEPEAGTPGPAAAVEIVQLDELVVGGGGDDDGSGAAVWLGVIAIVIAVLAALGTGLLWSSRPARLPSDDGEDG